MSDKNIIAKTAVFRRFFVSVFLSRRLECGIIKYQFIFGFGPKKGEINLNSFIAAIMSFLLALSSFFGVSGNTVSQEIKKFLSSEDFVSVIVELDEKSLLDGVSGAEERKELLESYLGSEKYEKILSAQKSVKKLIEKSVAAADFENSFFYSFVTNGFSLSVPYKYISSIEKLPGVKSVTVAERYSQPDEADITDGASDNKFSHNLFTGVPEAQEKGYTGKGIIIAVLDTGFECGHEAFASPVKNPSLSKSDIKKITAFKVLNTIVPRLNVNYYSEKIPYKWDYAEIDKTVENEHSDHGTHVAGIAAGKSDVLTGVAPDAQLLLMKVFGDEENSVAKEEVNLAALDDSVKLGADVVNMSLGSPCGQNHDNIFSKDVYNRLEKSGITVSCSAGNEASMGENDAVPGSEKMNADLFDYGTVGSPASYEWPVAVASSRINRSESNSPESIDIPGVGSADISSFSSWGVTADLRLKPEITTPGSDIYSSIPGNGYRYMNGTSMAAPYFAGCYALVKQYVNEKFPNTQKKDSAEFVNSLLMSTAVPFAAYGKSAYFSPRRIGAGLVSVESAIKTPVYLTQSDGVSRPKIELGEDTDGVLEFSFKAHNLSNEVQTYSLREAVLTDSYSKGTDGKYINTLTSREINENDYNVEYTFGADGKTVTLNPGESRKIGVKITVSDEFVSAYREVFKNGFFVDGFVFLDGEGENRPTLSIPFVSFNGDWSNPMLFDNTLYDSEPSYLGKEWGLMVTDGKNYYPLGANMFEKGTEYGIDSKYCAYSENALQSKLKNPYVTVSVGLIRNGKRMDYNLFTKSGIFRYCGSSLFEYARKTNNPKYPETGLLWGGKSGLIDGNGYVYKVSTTPANYKSKRVTISFPFTADNEKPTIESADYKIENGEAILTVKIKDNRYVMGFEMFGKGDRSLGSVSFKNIEPENGVYTYTVNVSEKSKKQLSSLSDIKLYVVDYAYNETYGAVSLSGEISDKAEIDEGVLTAPRMYEFSPSSVVVDTTEKEGAKPGTNSFFKRLFEKIKNAF